MVLVVQDGGLYLVELRLEDVFDELSEKYVELMDVLAQVASCDGLQHASGLLRLYERWVRTQSRRDEALLREKGIIPSKTSAPHVLH